MAYVQVNIVAPDGKKYRSEVDDQVDYDELLKALVADLKLPVANSPSVDYELAISGAVKLTDGATIHILAWHPHTGITRDTITGDVIGGDKRVVLVE